MVKTLRDFWNEADGIYNFLDNLYFSIQGMIEHSGKNSALEYAKNGKLW